MADLRLAQTFAEMAGKAKIKPVQRGHGIACVDCNVMVGQKSECDRQNVNGAAGSICAKTSRGGKGDGMTGFEWMARWGTLVLAVVVLAVGVLAGSGRAQELSALARLDAAASSLQAAGGGIDLQLALSQPVPWRVVTLDAPPRLVLDFREVDFGNSGAITGLGLPDGVVALRTGRFRPGWSRLVLELAGPYGVTLASMDTGGGTALVKVTLRPVAQVAFAAATGALNQGDWALPEPAPVAPAKRRQTGGAPLVVVLDPGHGGVDPGAETGNLNEAALVLTLALELQEALIRAGMRVELTRDTDVFVPLETRISVARAVGADLFLSLHADTIAEGVARGATVYTLADTATDAASAALAERHDRADLLAGVDLSEQDDLVATVLMEMARADTTPRANRLADALVASIKAAKLAMHKRPRLSAAFSVLKSPDIPSVLLELGFLSSDRDLANLQDADWRTRMVAALVAALAAWAVTDAAEAQLLRQ